MPTPLIITIALLTCPPFLLGLAFIWKFRRERRSDQSWATNPADAWKESSSWGRGISRGESNSFKQNNIGNKTYLLIFLGFLIASPALSFLRRLVGSDGPEYVLILSAMFGFLVLWIVYFRGYTFCFMDAGRINGRIEGKIGGPMSFLLRGGFRASLRCIELRNDGLQYRIRDLYEEQKEGQLNLSDPIVFSIPSDSPPTKLSGTPAVQWRLIISPKSELLPSLAFKIPVAYSPNLMGMPT